MNYIIILDDEKHIASDYKSILEDEGYKVDLATTIQEFYGFYDKHKPDLLILDILLKKDGANGIDFLSKLKMAEDFTSKVIILTGEGSKEDCARAIKIGAYALFDKQMLLSPDTFCLTIKQALNLKKQEDYSRYLEEKNLQLKKNITPILPLIGESAKMRQLKEQIVRLAKANVNVLIEGETGTGKEIVANHLFWNSENLSGPMITVDLGGIPDTLFESELFGHKKGAFTGTTANKKGYIEKAENSVLFWDEIENISFMLQAKILRAIENKEIQVLGGDKKNINTRFFFATNKDLYLLVREGKFREDLYYRMEKFKIVIPPLRERGDDIALLMDYFFHKYQKRFNNTFNTNLRAIVPNLLKHKWSGNVRELCNFCEYILYQKSHIDNNFILEEVKKKIEKTQKAGIDNQIFDYFDYGSYHNSMNNFEKEFICNSLNLYNNDVVYTANKLNLNPSSLYRKIKKHKINILKKYKNDL